MLLKPLKRRPRDQGLSLVIGLGSRFRVTVTVAAGGTGAQSWTPEWLATIFMSSFQMSVCVHKTYLAVFLSNIHMYVYE